MSITSKIVLSALLVGITVPAFAQGGTVAVQKPVITKQSTSIHKVATPVEAPKTGAAVSTGSNASSTGVAASTKPSVKPELGKSDTMKPDVTKPQVNTGISKPATPAVPATPATPATPAAPKIN